MKEKGKEKDIIDTWNGFVLALVRAKVLWGELQEITASMERKEFDKLPIEAQRFVTKSFFKATFNVMLPRMVDYWRTLGGLAKLKIQIKEKE